MLHIQQSKQGKGGLLSPELIFSVLAAAALVGVLLWNLNWPFLAEIDFAPLWPYRYAFLRGLGVTFLLAAVCIVFGAIIGGVLATALQVVPALFRWLIFAYVEIWRNIPIMVTLFWIHFALPAVSGISTTTMVSGMIAITLQCSAYLTDLARTGIQAVPKGQWESCYALGIPARTKWLRIILPQAIKVVIPPLANVGIGFFKATAILSALSVGEFMSTSSRIAEASFRPFETMMIVAIVYFVLGSLMSAGTYRLERILARAR